jgi:nucleoside-diphosphate-sugar epimerase
MGPVVYTGSVGMFDATDADPTDGRLRADASAHPPTHYGVFKLANEGNARVYWRDDGIASVGLRPMTVYGPGRDQGMTSGPTKAILAAVAGQPYRIPFGNRTLLQYVEDVARALIAAGRTGPRDAWTINLGGTLSSMPELIATIEAELPDARGLVTFDPAPLPFPEAIDTDGHEVLGEVEVTALREAVRRTIAVFRAGLASGRLDRAAVGAEPILAKS